MSRSEDRRRAQDVVAAYHRSALSDLVSHVGEAIDRHRAGELDAFEVDEVLFQYSRAAKELWKFCNLGHIEMTARLITEEPTVDWRQRGAPRGR